jgi:hypothetical protein
MLVNAKGYQKKDIVAGLEVLAKAGEKRAVIRVDFGITLHDKICMIFKYGPGSIVTRRRPALAASRLVAPYQVPVVIVTNGEDAETLDGTTGNVLALGLDAIPAKTELMKRCEYEPFEQLDPNRVTMEARILYAYDVDGSCPCDDSICRL